MEIWKDVVGYEGLYRVSNLGNIFGIKRNKNISPGLHRDGYLQVSLCKEGRIKQYKAHRIVALNFIDNPELKEQVNHIDGVKTNNFLNNLEWSTRSENLIHSCRVLGNHVGEKNYNYRKFLGEHSHARIVVQYDTYGNRVKAFSSIKEAEIKTGIFATSITRVCKGKNKSAGGYIWSYDQDKLPTAK